MRVRPARVESPRRLRNPILSSIILPLTSIVYALAAPPGTAIGPGGAAFDGDGLSDGAEVDEHGTDPLGPARSGYRRRRDRRPHRSPRLR